MHYNICNVFSQGLSTDTEADTDTVLLDQDPQ